MHKPELSSRDALENAAEPGPSPERQEKAVAPRRLGSVPNVTSSEAQSEDAAERPHRKHARDTYVDFLRAQRNALDMIPELTREEFAWSVWITLRAGVSQSAAAEKFTVTQPTLSRWARGEHVPTNPVILGAYLAALKECFDDFISDAIRSSETRTMRPGPRVPQPSP